MRNNITTGQQAASGDQNHNLQQTFVFCFLLRRKIGPRRKGEKKQDFTTPPQMKKKKASLEKKCLIQIAY